MRHFSKAALFSLLLCLLLSAAQAESLTIAGVYDHGALIRRYQQDNPDAEIVESYDYFESVEELVNAMLFQETSFDIMTLWTGNQNIDMLMEKGYCPALEGSEIIAEKVGQMYPAIQNAVTMNGHIYALPLAAWCTEMAYDPRILAELGLEVPSSFADIADLINSWKDLPPEISEDYQPVMYIENYPNWFLLRSTERYVNTLAARGKSLSFDTPAYHALMNLQSTLSDALNDNPNWEDLPAPFYSGVDITSWPWLRLVPLELDGDVIYRGQMYVAIINPYSKHQEEALAFLEWVAQNYTNIERLYLFSGETEPVEDPWYPTMISNWTKRRDELLEKLENCDGAERRSVQEELEIHEAQLTTIEKTRYEVSPEDIAAWEEVMPHMVFIPPTVLDLDDDSFHTLEFRYLDGQLSLEGYIAEMEKVATMIRMENGE